jgi:hypothetical protein
MGEGCHRARETAKPKAVILAARIGHKCPRPSFETRARARLLGMTDHTAAPATLPGSAATFSGFVVAYALREAGVFGLITAAMIIVIVAIAVWGSNVRGKPLDAG